MSEENQAPQELSKNLGLAGKTAKAFIVSPLSLLLLVAFISIGILGLQITPRQEDPQISVPMVDIYVQYPGASSEEVEDQVARPLEGLMQEITGVKHVYSASSRGQALVTVQFKVGEDFESSIVKLRDKLEANKSTMPAGVANVLAKPVGVDDVPVVTLTLWSNEVDDAQLRLLALDLLQKLREEANTSQSFIVDGRKDQVRVEILPERLATYGVSLGQVANSIRLANSERKAGSFEPGSNVIDVVTGSFLEGPDDIKQLMVAIVEGRPVYVRDVAKVTLQPSDASKIVGYYTGNHAEVEEIASGAAAVTLAIAKKHGSNGVEVAEGILKRVETLKGQIVPDNVNVAITRDYGNSAKEKVNGLLKKLVIATLIVTALVFLFLGWRASSVVLIVIPIVITVTVFSAWALGLTIDRVSLFALIFSIGILVDDAIVVVENIYRRWLLANDLEIDTAVDAVREVGNPTILATFTVIAALLPMGFVSGMMGPYMSPIPILGSVAMLFSLFAAFAFTPWLTNKFKPSMSSLQESAEKEHKQAAFIEKFFRGLIIPLIRNPRKGKILLYGIIVVFFLSILLFYPAKYVKVKMLPLDNKPEFNVVVNLPEGTALPVTANLIHSLATELQKVEEVIALQTYAGTASPFNFNGLVRHYYVRDKPWMGDIQVQLTHKNDRERSSHEIAEAVRHVLTPIAEAVNAKIQVVEMPPGPPVLQSVVAEIYGPTPASRRQFAEDMTGFFEQAENLTDVDNFLEADHNVLRFEVDADKAQRNGISVEDINRTIEMAMGGFILGDIKKGAVIEPLPIVLQVPLSARSQIDRLAQLPVMGPRGNSVPLSALVNFYTEKQDKPIYHKDLRPVEFVTAETTGEFAAPVYGQFEVQDLMAAANNGEGYKAPDGVVINGGYWLSAPDHSANQSLFEWGGEWTVTFETFRDMGIAFMAALVLIYMLIVAQFGNFVLPAVVMAPIPLTLIGIVPGHWLLGAEFSATSMIGFIALAGIIVRNSILLVDFSREAVMNKGMTVVEAVIHACEARTRPIAITAFALIGGSMVILDDPIFQGMAVSLIFGGLVSTLLTLLVIPLGCISAGKSLCADMVDADGNVIPCGGIDDAVKPDEPKPVNVYEESFMEKVMDIGSTVVGIVVMVGTLILTTIKGIFGFIISKLFRKNKELQPKSEVKAEPKAEAEQKDKPEADDVEAKKEIVEQKEKSEVAEKTAKANKARRGIRLKKDL
ncbi:MAG: Acriflavin resistance protein [uncultured Thiotrichaceae bacterium]|uniref:Acriflavin resistance protein n=1 Tax=uncultured Thiotrichaceae bacterium TaxID=298394 RepID=A0A6S6ST64_9GAMM|nr:MAG: Acriflavin resistance protein [uncultured Thiotrichaceae bacterium]